MKYIKLANQLLKVAQKPLRMHVSVQGLADDIQKAIDKDLEKTLKKVFEKLALMNLSRNAPVSQAEQQKKNIQSMTDEIVQDLSKRI